MAKIYKVFQENVFDKEKTFVTYDESFYPHNYVRRDNEMYESIYLYNDEHLEHYKTHKNDKGNNTLAGIRNNFTDKVVFDFDKKENPAKALTDARILVGELLGFIEPKAIRCFFSGNKGYHVEIHFNQTIVREQFEAIINEYAKSLKTFDHKIKDQQRLFRFPLSQNKETKLYKIPMTTDQFLDMSNTHTDIKSIAADPDWEQCNETIASYSTIDIPEQFLQLFEEKQEDEVETDETDDAPNMEFKPKFLNAAKYVLSQGYFEEGERNEACMVLAATYRYLNFTQNQAYAMIKDALRQRAKRLGLKYNDDTKKELWNTIITKVYADTWQGGTYSDTENPLLLKTIERYDLGRYYNSNVSKDIVRIDEVAQNFVNFANNIDNNLIKTGIAEIDKDIIITSSMLVGFLGAPSSGKTTCSLNIAENQMENNIPTFFVSADMGDKLFFARMMQKYCGYSFQRIVDEMKNKPYSMWTKQLQTAFDIVKDKFKNMGMAFNSGPTIETIRDAVDQYEQDTGRGVKCLFVDYLEKMRCDYSDANAASAYNASRLADFTRDKDLTTFLMLQTQKQGGDPSDELTSMRRVKGSSVIEQDCRLIFATWRPGFNPDYKGVNPDDKFASIAVVKNNMGTTGRYDFGFDGAKGLYLSLTEEGLADLDEVRQRAAARKAAKANGTYTPPSSARGKFDPKTKTTVKPARSLF